VDTQTIRQILTAHQDALLALQLQLIELQVGVKLEDTGDLKTQFEKYIKSMEIARDALYKQGGFNAPQI
jgi:hypothetical protein